MFDWHVYLSGFAAIVLLAVGTWLISLAKKDVSIVDSLWSLLFLAAAIVYVLRANTFSSRSIAMLVLVAAWALRLAIYLTARNWRQPEDYRYQKIRADNEPHFAFKSLYIVFLLQGVLAWIVSLPLLAGATVASPWSWLDSMGTALVLFGLLFEAVADAQLARFKRNPNSHGKVMDQGLWRYSRHPNYFGECCVWWGFYLFAVGGGVWTWTLIGPVLMTFLLLKVSGVAMLERTIGKRRPEYQSYIERTSTFIPRPPKKLA